MPVVAPEELITVEVEQLLCVPLQRDEYVVKDLIPKGLTLFCGGQKVGKSWMMLDLCERTLVNVYFLDIVAVDIYVGYSLGRKIINF